MHLRDIRIRGSVVTKLQVTKRLQLVAIITKFYNTNYEINVDNYAKQIL